MTWASEPVATRFKPGDRIALRMDLMWGATWTIPVMYGTFLSYVSSIDGDMYRVQLEGYPEPSVIPARYIEPAEAWKLAEATARIPE